MYAMQRRGGIWPIQTEEREALRKQSLNEKTAASVLLKNQIWRQLQTEQKEITMLQENKNTQEHDLADSRERKTQKSAMLCKSRITVLEDEWQS